MQKKKPKREAMVQWFSPRVLAQTGRDVLISGTLGRHTDFRKLEGLHGGEEPFYDYGAETGRDFWLDYIADTGDGWDPTYAVARYVSQNKLKLADLNGRTHETDRGRVLVFGGDQVYPSAGRDFYQTRLIEPFEQAAQLSESLEQRDVYAIPGNHDWYDSLVSFTRLFCARRSFAGSRTRQSRSYFALRLPYGWWLLAADVQLNCDIDDRQYRFFESVSRQMQAEDRIILCVGEPYWILREKYGEKSLAKVLDDKAGTLLSAKAKQSVQQLEHKLEAPFTLGDARFSERPLEILEQEVLKRRISVFIAGDYHHYRRFATRDQTRHKITAGGGGAFLHPTHDLPNNKILAPSGAQGERFLLQPHSFPDARTSWWLTWRNLAFPLLNPAFGWIVGALYLIVGWPVAHRVYQSGALSGGLYESVQAALRAMTPGQLLVLLAFYVAGILFTDTHSRLYRVLAGVTHTSAHIWSAFALGALAAHWVMPLVGPYLLCLLAAGAFIAVAGALTGSLLWGVYLLVSLNAFGRHANEAFSSLRIADYKNFLRLRIGADGELTIYPVGIERVPRWKKLWARARRGSAPRLIEGPIRVAASHTESA